MVNRVWAVDPRVQFEYSRSSSSAYSGSHGSIRTINSSQEYNQEYNLVCGFHQSRPTIAIMTQLTRKFPGNFSHRYMCPRNVLLTLSKWKDLTRLWNYLNPCGTIGLWLFRYAFLKFVFRTNKNDKRNKKSLLVGQNLTCNNLTVERSDQNPWKPSNSLFRVPRNTQ